MQTLPPRDRVVELLRTLVEAENAWHSGSSGGGVRLLPSIYNEGSYAELERCLDTMRDGAQRREWWHVSSRYLWGKEHDQLLRYRRTTKGPIPELPPRSELLISIEVQPKSLMLTRLYTWSDRVEHQLVEQGLDHLLAMMYNGDTQRITLPRELLYLALGKEPINGKHSPHLATHHQY